MSPVAAPPRGPGYVPHVVRIQGTGALYRILLTLALLGLIISFVVVPRGTWFLPDWVAILCVLAGVWVLARGVWITRSHVVLVNIWGVLVFRRSHIRRVYVDTRVIWVSRFAQERTFLGLEIEGRRRPVRVEAAFVEEDSVLDAYQELVWRLTDNLGDPVFGRDGAGKPVLLRPASLAAPRAHDGREQDSPVLPVDVDTARALIPLQVELSSDAWTDPQAGVQAQRIAHLPRVRPLIIQHRDLALAVVRTLMPGYFDAAGVASATEILEHEPSLTAVERALASRGLGLRVVPSGWVLCPSDAQGSVRIPTSPAPETLIAELHAERLARIDGLSPIWDETEVKAIEATSALLRPIPQAEQGLIAATFLLTERDDLDRFRLAIVDADTAIIERERDEDWMLNALIDDGYAAPTLWDYVSTLGAEAVPVAMSRPHLSPIPRTVVEHQED
ncbi:hypothetical protein M2390_000182 [Mycetocola sp. BIGb0189]|uniref:hypothetical protein n=1 Tax=Mycetocola sp. BIGb0189 TaxID=2940604 RepID=UPI002166F75C|nr:hypothetical protein [Mycetocola sp. BIGb0189]MCS4275024.1 hypothetical protein [Mycetocola sp. BIGb0189]